MRFISILLIGLALSGCQLIYKLPTRQGNVLEQKDVVKLKTGMTREQVSYVLGTPVATSPFTHDRWDYVSYYKPPRGEPIIRQVHVYFDGDKVVKLDGVDAFKPDASTTPDVDTIIKEEKKNKTEDERNEGPSHSGVTITPKGSGDE